MHFEARSCKAILGPLEKLENVKFLIKKKIVEKRFIDLLVLSVAFEFFSVSNFFMCFVFE